MVAKVEAIDKQPTSAQPRSVEGRAWVAVDDAALVVRWDLYLTLLGMSVILFVAIRTLGSKDLTHQKPNLLGSEELVAQPSAESYLVADVTRALQRSEELFKRSTLLLVSGVVMAFVGVAVFFMSLSTIDARSDARIVDELRFRATRMIDEQLFRVGEIARNLERASPDQPSNVREIGAKLDHVIRDLKNSSSVERKTDVTLLLFQGFKSAAMLIFIEAIAWFLLRQYRALIEDYKSFYRYYMRRTNYLTAAKLMQEAGDNTLRQQLVAVLLNEDLSGRIKQGETTEGIETHRLTDSNFAETLLSRSSEVAQKALTRGSKTEAAAGT